jgi:hypothetical protein
VHIVEYSRLALDHAITSAKNKPRAMRVTTTLYLFARTAERDRIIDCGYLLRLIRNDSEKVELNPVNHTRTLQSIRNVVQNNILPFNVARQDAFDAYTFQTLSQPRDEILILN